jgi:ketosteroid isomerase-like protein
MRLLLAAIVLVMLPQSAAQSPTTKEIDRDVWSVFSATVAGDDIAGMGKAYHPDAVLVNPRETTPISSALDRWGKDMVANKGKGIRATVEFRFTKRQDGATTAFEAGMFKYTTVEKGGAAKPGYYPFEALLTKSNGKWRVMMERQFDAVTEADWNKLPK